MLTLGNPQKEYGIAEGKDLYVDILATTYSQAKSALYLDVLNTIISCSWFDPYVNALSETAIKLETASEFWSSDKLTGSQTYMARSILQSEFWSSDKLTGSQTVTATKSLTLQFWSSDKLTGSQTAYIASLDLLLFWSSDKLTGSQTQIHLFRSNLSFGAVTN